MDLKSYNFVIRLLGPLACSVKVELVSEGNVSIFIPRDVDMIRRPILNLLAEATDESNIHQDGSTMCFYINTGEVAVDVDVF